MQNHKCFQIMISGTDEIILNPVNQVDQIIKLNHIALELNLSDWPSSKSSYRIPESYSSLPDDQRLQC